jgi:hypothetical protein
MKFLIDNCLSPELADLARQRGYIESVHVSHRNRSDAEDRQLMPYILAGDWTFVTRNSRDFRGSSSDPGKKGQYRRAEPHAGLVCVNGPIGMDLDMRLEAFCAVLDALGADSPEPDLTNQVLEATVESQAAPDIVLRRYDLPSAGGTAHRDASVPRQTPPSADDTRPSAGPRSPRPPRR